MEMKISDMFDRWTILIMKARFDNAAKEELKFYDNQVSAFLTSDAFNITFLKIVLELVESNAKIWQLEAGIRKEYSSDESNVKINDENYIEIGKRAIAIRDNNKLRIQAKTKIDKIFGQFVDVKVNHASE